MRISNIHSDVKISVSEELNFVILLSGNLSISNSKGEYTLPKKSFLLYDQPFEVIAISPYVDGYILSIPQVGEGPLQDIIQSIKKKTEVFRPYVLKDAPSKKMLISSLQDPGTKGTLQASYLHILLSTLYEESLVEDEEEVSLFQQFSDLIDENVEHNYCAGEYANMLDISLKELIKEVKETVGQTPCSVITERVINSAKNRLLGTSDSSKMIAYQLGFDDPYYFIKYFKKNTGLTPTQFREAI